jgi:transposase
MSATRTGIEDLRGMMTVSDLAAVTGLGWDTVKNIINGRLEKDYGHPRLKELQRLSLDEIYVGRGKKFYTLVIDLDTGRIVWVAPGRGGDALRKFWRALRLSKAKIKAVAMDMSPAYWAAVLEHLPDAAIVFDRFHIVKLVNEKLDDLWRDMVREATGLMKQAVKGVRYLLLMRRENVEPEKLPRLEEALKHNEPLSIGYLLKEGLGLLWEQSSYPPDEIVPPSVVRLGHGVRGAPDEASGQDPVDPCQWHSLVVETSDQQRADGRDQQQDQNNAAPNLRLAR